MTGCAPGLALFNGTHFPLQSLGFLDLVLVISIFVRSSTSCALRPSRADELVLQVGQTHSSRTQGGYVLDF